MIDIDLDGINKEYSVYLEYLAKLAKVKRKISSYKLTDALKKELDEYNCLKENQNMDYFDKNGLFEDEMYLFLHDDLNEYMQIIYEKEKLLREFNYFLDEISFFTVDFYSYYVCLKEPNNYYRFIDLEGHNILSIQEDDINKVNYLISVLQAANSFVATIRQKDLPFITNLMDDWDIIHEDIKGKYYSPSYENAPMNMGLIYYRAYMKDRNLAKITYPSKQKSLCLLNSNQYDESFFDYFDDSELIKKMFTGNIEKLYKKSNLVDKEKILDYYHILSTSGYQNNEKVISLFTTSPVINIELLKRKYLKK